jgi:hypothetical protein
VHTGCNFELRSIEKNGISKYQHNCCHTGDEIEDPSEITMITNKLIKLKVE